MAKRKILIPEAAEQLAKLKAEVMERDGYKSDSASPDDVKYEVAKQLDIPLHHGKNGNLTSEQAGQIGGQIGGRMVKELIKRAQEHLKRQ